MGVGSHRKNVRSTNESRIGESPMLPDSTGNAANRFEVLCFRRVRRTCGFVSGSRFPDFLSRFSRMVHNPAQSTKQNRKKEKKKLKKKNESQAFTVQLYSFTLTTYLLSRRVVYFTLPRYHIIHIVALLVLP